MSVYTKTARKANDKNKTVYAFGRDDSLDGHHVEKGGYIVWKLCENYSGSVRGGIAKTWRYVEKDMPYEGAIALMNKKLGRAEFSPDPA
jgi:hypothetical protein